MGAVQRRLRVELRDVQQDRAARAEAVVLVVRRGADLRVEPFTGIADCGRFSCRPVELPLFGFVNRLSGNGNRHGVLVYG